MSITIEIPKYTGKSCAAVVHALKIKYAFENPRGVELHFYNKQVCPIQVSAAVVGSNDVAGDYIVWDRYGEVSIQRSDDFEDRFAPAS